MKLSLMSAQRATVVALMSLTLASSYAQEVKVMTLDEMFKLAEEANPTLVEGRSSVSEAQAAVASAKTGRTPDIELNVRLSAIGNAWVADRDFSNGMNSETPHFGNMFSLAITQMLYAGGAIKNSISMAELAEDMAGLSLEAKRQAVRILVAGYYLDLRQLRNQATIIEKNIDQTRKLVEDIEANYNAGTALKSDVTRYELQLQTLALRQTQTQSAIDITSRYLTEALGLPADTRIEPDTTSIVDESAIESEAYWASLAAENPSVRIASKNLEISNKQTDLTRAGMRPTVVLRLEDQLEGPITYEIPTLDKNVNFYYAAVQVTYNFGSLYKQKRKVSQSKVATATAEASLNSAMSQSSAGVHAAYVSFQESLTDRDTHRKSVQLAHENYDVVHYRYLNGMALVTDMLDASNQQLSAELGLANAEIQIVYRRLMLLASVGKL